MIRRAAHSGLIGNYIATDQLSTPVPAERTLLPHIASLTSASRKIQRGERNVTLLNVLRIAAAINQRPSEILAAAGL